MNLLHDMRRFVKYIESPINSILQTFWCRFCQQPFCNVVSKLPDWLLMSELCEDVGKILKQCVMTTRDCRQFSSILLINMAYLMGEGKNTAPFFLEFKK